MPSIGFSPVRTPQPVRFSGLNHQLEAVFERHETPNSIAREKLRVLDAQTTCIRELQKLNVPGIANKGMAANVRLDQERTERNLLEMIRSMPRPAFLDFMEDLRQAPHYIPAVDSLFSLFLLGRLQGKE